MSALLITGAAGFIGSSLAGHFAGQGWQVLVDASAVDSLARLSPEPRLPRAVLTAAALAEATGGVVPDAIIHAAGSSTVAKVAADPSGEMARNLASLLAMLEYAGRQAPQAHVVVLSSAAVYGNAPAEPQREEDAREPVSLYGVTKAQAEQLAAFHAHQHGQPTSAVRLFSVYGPGLRKQLLWDAMVKFGRGQGEFFGSGQEQRDWLHIDDVCRFMGRLLAMPRAGGFEVFNCAGGQAASTAEVLGHLAGSSGNPAPRFNGQSRAGDPRCLVADCSKALRLLDWRAQVAWRDGVAEYAGWFAAQAAEIRRGGSATKVLR